MNDEQGILAADVLPGGGGARLRLSLLAAGFVLGPSGCSVRDIISTSGADIRSWTEFWQPPAGCEGTAAGGGGGRSAKIRTFVIEVGAGQTYCNYCILLKFVSAVGSDEHLLLAEGTAGVLCLRCLLAFRSAP